jgi:hypothetical protein
MPSSGKNGIFGNTRMLDEGALAIRMLNKTGSASVKGTIVETSATTAEAFDTITADAPDPIGIVYESGVADGGYCWIVIQGKCQVLLEDTTAATKDYWVKVSDSDAGRADATNVAPPGGAISALEDHFTEIGHALEDVTAGTDKLCWIIFHCN